MLGWQNRSADDEKMLLEIGRTNVKNNTSKIKILDARSYIAAMANRVNKGGFESSDFYTNCEILFGEIDNIHKVRESFNKVYSYCQLGMTSNGQQAKWWSNLESTAWY